MAIANYNEEKPLIIYTFKKLYNGEQRLAAQHYVIKCDIVLLQETWSSSCELNLLCNVKADFEIIHIQVT